MPIAINRVSEDPETTNQEIAWLCEKQWEITPQVEALKEWVKSPDFSNLPENHYIADIGFGWRRDAMAGGPVLEPEFMLLLAEKGITLHLSEYAFFTDGGQTSLITRSLSKFANWLTRLRTIPSKRQINKISLKRLCPIAGLPLFRS